MNRQTSKAIKAFFSIAVVGIIVALAVLATFLPHVLAFQSQQESFVSGVGLTMSSLPESDYWLSETEVTQRAWNQIMGTNPSQFRGDDRPVENVNWFDAMNFCLRLTERDQANGTLPRGYKYSLPTERQWEYACQAGYRNPEVENNIDRIAWYRGNSGGETQPVETKAQNRWFFSDLQGNVAEWCLEQGGGYYVARGGSWNHEADSVTPRAVIYCSAEDRSSEIGFRIAAVRSE